MLPKGVGHLKLRLELKLEASLLELTPDLVPMLLRLLVLDFSAECSWVLSVSFLPLVLVLPWVFLVSFVALER
jgi:hypothetical protein